MRLHFTKILPPKEGVLGSYLRAPLSSSLSGSLSSWLLNNSRAHLRVTLFHPIPKKQCFCNASINHHKAEHSGTSPHTPARTPLTPPRNTFLNQTPLIHCFLRRMGSGGPSLDYLHACAWAPLRNTHVCLLYGMRISYAIFAKW